MSNGSIYVGVDLHKRQFSFVMVNESGQVVTRGTQEATMAGVASFAATLDRRHHLAVEPLDNVFWFIREVSAYAGSVHIANPYKVRLIAESRMKSDGSDAQILADLLRVGYLPEVYIPSAEIIESRRVISHRIRLVRDRVRLKNRILTVIGREGCVVKASDPFGRNGRREITHVPVTAQAREMVTMYLAGYDLLTSQIAQVDRQISELGAGDPIVQLLRSIDGVETFTALAIRSAVGEMKRFRSAKAFASYTGLVPGYRQSAESHHSSSITKQGVTTIRWLLIQAVPHAVRQSDYLRRLYRRICFRASVGHAKVAVAHALARIIYHVWLEARPYYR